MKSDLVRAMATTAGGRRATIGDVAALAGVSKATVSRFFNHRERLLSPDIQARVEASIAQLGYSPNPMARALSHGHSRLIGLIVADITNPYSVAVLRGAEKACQEAGYLVILFNLGNESGRETEALEALAGYRVDGFILNTLGHGNSVVDAMTLHGKPSVLVDRRHAGMQADFVSLDNASAMAVACDHLIGNGYRELLYVTQPINDVSTRRERADAFMHCVSAHRDQQVSGQVLENEEADGDRLDQALNDLLSRASAKSPVAVVSGNAVVTLKVAASVARLKRRFGTDVGFVGFDDADWAPLIGPGLTTIAQPTDDLGRTAARCLIERLNGLSDAPRQWLLQGRLEVRGSSRTD